MSLLNTFESSISSFLKGVQSDAVFLVAVSGGADSMALLASLCAVVPKEKLICIHIEHGLRPAEESCGDADFVSDFCKVNGIECVVKHIKPGKITETAKRKGIGIEAAARYFRHRALSKEARRLDSFILLAHTKDDLLETALMRVLRGVGPAGLAAMPQRRGRILRPLLTMSRAEIIDYLNAKNISWCEDSTNTDTQFLRNRIRHKLVPLLNEAFPSWEKGIAALAETQSLVADFIKNEAELRIKWKKSSHGDTETQRNGKKSNLFISTDEESFFMQAQVIREESVFLGINFLRASSEPMVRDLCEPLLSTKSIRRSVVRQFCEGKTKAADLGSVRVIRENGKIIITKTQKNCFERGFSRLV